MLKFSGFVAVLIVISCTISFSQTLFNVEVSGKGRPLILVHGLYCTGEVWDETVARYQKNYECHVLTLAGFGGKAAHLTDHFLEDVKNEIITYVKTKKLNKPIIMGHSMGGFLAFWAAASSPDLFAGLISVDGLPFLPAIQKQDATVASSKETANYMKLSMANQSPEMIVASQKMYLPMMISDTVRIRQVSKVASKGDSKTMAEVMYELYSIDLRQEVSKIQCPVLMLGAWIAYKDYGATHDGATTLYSAQLKGIKNTTLEISDTAKHFIFYDDPTWFFSKVDQFLGKL